ncbi:MAG: hypothetical protein IJL08_06055 [Oscillospiraceae bacterium]|nr:hypothetical protein [Oscillospiraceae bacterium]
MNKRTFIAPYIVLSGISSGGDDNVIGGGTGQGGSDAVPCSYEAWLESVWKADLFLDGQINEDDYAMWWEGNGFSQEDWELLNPDLPWDDYFG